MPLRPIGCCRRRRDKRRERFKLLQSPYFFRPFHPHAINPASPTHGHIVFSPVSLVSRDQDGGPSPAAVRFIVQCKINTVFVAVVVDVVVFVVVVVVELDIYDLTENRGL